MKQAGFTYKFDGPSPKQRLVARTVDPDEVERQHVLAAKRRLAVRLAISQAA